MSSDRIPIGIPPSTQILRIERVVSRRLWLVWLLHDTQFNYGTYLELHDDGTIMRTTDRPNSTDTVMIKPHD